MSIESKAIERFRKKLSQQAGAFTSRRTKVISIRFLMIQEGMS